MLFTLLAWLVATPSSATSLFRWEKESLPIAQEGPYWVSEWTEVELPALASFQIVGLGSPNTLVQVTDLVDPAGQVFVNSGAPLKFGSEPVLRNVISLNRSEAVSPGTASLIVPNNPALTPLHAGRWRFRFLSHKEPTQKFLRVLVLGKAAAEPGEVPVKVWIAPESYWATANVDGLLARAAEILATAGARLRVEKAFLPAALRAALDAPEDPKNLALAQNELDRVNVYLLPTMRYQSKPVNGLACIGGPGPIGLAHGCFVSVYASPKAAEYTFEQQAKVIAHEIGHYLGLFHTRDEGFPILHVVYDSLDDTPTEITGANLMDTGISEMAPALTPQQGAMIRLSPNVL